MSILEISETDKRLTDEDYTVVSHIWFYGEVKEDI